MDKIILVNNCISYMTLGCTKYLSKNSGNCIGYPSGKICNNDVVVRIKSQSKYLVIEAWLWKNEDILPYNKKVETDKNDLVDTVYANKSIKIEAKEEKYIFTIENQIIEDKITKEYLIIIDDNGIKFFGNLDEEETKKILLGSKFSSYIIENIEYRNLDLISVIDREVVCFLEGLTANNLGIGLGDIKYISSIGENIKGTKQQIYIGEGNATVYTLSGKAEIYRFIKGAFEDIERLNNLEEKYIPKEEYFSQYHFLGRNRESDEIKRILGKAALTNTTILLTGESGTGKTFLAKKIHNSSKRNEKSFVHVNCGAIPYNLIESELFGYVEGAFTGAKKGGKKGYFDLANQGTLFLDEIAEIPMELQGRLLEVIQNRTFYRVGGVEKINTDIRLIAATNKNLQSLVEKGEFREDLYYRINVFPIELPPLRERKEDFGHILRNMIPRICYRLDIEPVKITEEALMKLSENYWKGNIRELENIVERLAIICDEGIITEKYIKETESLSNTCSKPYSNENINNYGTLELEREKMERLVIRDLLRFYEGSKQKTSKHLDISRTTLFEKIRKYNLEEGE